MRLNGCNLLLGVAALTHSTVSADDSPDAHKAPKDCITYINIARTARLNTDIALIGIVKKSKELVKEALEEVSELAGKDEDDCDRGITLSPYQAGGLIYTFAPNTQPNCPQLIQGTVDAAMKRLTGYPWDQSFDPAVAPYNDLNVQQMFYMLYAGSTKIGCAMTLNCQKGSNVLFCKFDPLFAKGSWPFSPDYYNSLRQRADAGVLISTLSVNDISRAAGEVAAPSLVLLAIAASVILLDV